MNRSQKDRSGLVGHSPYVLAGLLVLVEGLASDSNRAGRLGSQKRTFTKHHHLRDEWS